MLRVYKKVLFHLIEFGNGARMTATKSEDIIKLQVLPTQPMARIVRLTTSALANLVGLNLDQADDLNTAVEEVFSSITVDEEEDLELFNIRYLVLKEKLEVILEAVPMDLSDQSSSINRYSRFVIESIIDELDDIPNPEHGFDIHLVKYLSS